MKSLLLLVAALALTTGCKELDGHLQVHKPLQVKKDGNAQKTISKGAYEVEIKYKADKNRIDIKAENAAGDKIKFNYTHPAGYQLPENGTFYISAEASNQDFDLSGENSVIQNVSEVRRGWESCMSDFPERECYYDQYGRPFCRDVRRYGQRYVEYRDVTTVYATDAQLISGNEVIAELSADRSESERQYLEVGYCR